MTDAITNLTTIISSVLDIIEGNSVMMIYFVAGLLGVAVSVIKRLVGRY